MEHHDGHRRRMKERFAEHGLDNFSDVHALELLLFYALPQRDTEPLAHRLIDRFGSLNAVFEATIQELQQVDGVGENTAIFINLIPQLSRRYMMSFARDVPQFNSVKDIGRYLIPFFMHKRDEEVYLLCLDDVNRLLGCRQLSGGTVNAADINIRKVVETALNFKATKVVLAHNHPDGAAIPSAADRQATNQVDSVLRAIGIELVDHLVIHGDDFASVYADI